MLEKQHLIFQSREHRKHFLFRALHGLNEVRIFVSSLPQRALAGTPETVIRILVQFVFPLIEKVLSDVLHRGDSPADFVGLRLAAVVLGFQPVIYALQLASFKINDLSKTLQRGLELLGTEINRTKRITNALEYILIPSLQATIRFLAMKFEERDREEKARLKRVKALLAAKEAA